ncbi:hypothetical protein J3A83DRAFT_4192452 [Scleroderma citrinum]
MGELDKVNGGYGSLFSLTSTSTKAPEAFFDALAAAKLEWAVQYGVDEALVRVSVRTGDRKDICNVAETALSVTESSFPILRERSHKPESSWTLQPPFVMFVRTG